MTEIADRTLRAGGPALLFENPKGSDTPVLCNLFGTPGGSLWAWDRKCRALRDVGELLAFLKPTRATERAARSAWDKAPRL